MTIFCLDRGRTEKDNSGVCLMNLSQSSNILAALQEAIRLALFFSYAEVPLPKYLFALSFLYGDPSLSLPEKFRFLVSF
jgi:hypothetical protein